MAKQNAGSAVSGTIMVRNWSSGQLGINLQNTVIPAVPFTLYNGDQRALRDVNGNGAIDSGRELFGDETILTTGPNAGSKATHGFTALADLNGNGDALFDASDAQYANLALWRDLNQDGISQANELKTLADSGIQSISLTSSPKKISYTDAILTQSGTFTRSDNTTSQAGSFILAQNNYSTSFPPIAVSAPARDLPYIAGSGFVRGLRSATRCRNSLKTSREQDLRRKSVCRSYGVGTNSNQNSSYRVLA